MFLFYSYIIYIKYIFKTTNKLSKKKNKKIKIIAKIIFSFLIGASYIYCVNGEVLYVYEIKTNEEKKKKIENKFDQKKKIRKYFGNKIKNNLML